MTDLPSSLPSTSQLSRMYIGIEFIFVCEVRVYLPLLVWEMVVLLTLIVRTCDHHSGEDPKYLFHALENML